MRKHSWVIIILFMIQSACAPVRPDHLAQPDKGQLGRVGIVVGDFEPIIALTGSKGRGIAQSILAWMEICDGLIICLPVGATVGATFGVVDSVGFPNNISIAKGNLQANIESLTLQERLRSSLMQYANSVELKLSPLSQGTGPTTPTDMPDYQFLSDKLDTVVEVVALELIANISAFRGDPTSLQLKAKVRVVNTHDGSLIDAFPVISTPSFSRYAEHWLIDDAKKLQDRIAAAIREIAETTVNEVLLIYHPAKRIARNHRVPNYALRPIEPPLRTKIYWINRTLWDLERFQLAALDPTFEWEPFPRGFDIIIGDDSGQAQQVLYDFRIYDMAGIIYERVGLNVTRHKLEIPLQSCRSYRWTVRSRFNLNGVPRATEWTGAFNLFGGEVVAPWWWRRGSKPFLDKLIDNHANIAYYPIIETPSGISGKKCSDK